MTNHRPWNSQNRSTLPNNAPAPTSSKNWSPCVTVPTPGTSVKVFVGVGVRVALEQLDAVRHDFVDGDPDEVLKWILDIGYLSTQRSMVLLGGHHFVPIIYFLTKGWQKQGKYSRIFSYHICDPPIYINQFNTSLLYPTVAKTTGSESERWWLTETPKIGWPWFSLQ